MIHIEKRVKYLLFIFGILSESGIASTLIASQQQILSLDYLANVLFFPTFLFCPCVTLLANVIKLKALKFKVQLIFHKLFDALNIDLVQFRDETRADEPVLEAQSDLLAIREDELVQVVKNELQGLGVGLVDFDDLRDAARIEWLVLYVAEVTKNFLDFILHQFTLKMINHASI